MLFVLTPQNPSAVNYDPEETFHEYRRREYIAALQEQQQRTQFQRELAVEQERHRIALATLARQEAARRQRQASARFARSAEEPQAPRRHCCQPAPEEILARRLAREQEEQRRSRQFHEHILSQIFGVQTGESAQQPAAQETSLPSTSTSADKGKQSTAKRPLNEESQPHWSAAPERARALAEIANIDRTYRSLKNTFVFPSGHLERLPESDLPRLAYNPTNATIHSHEHALAELLTKLDGVESYGFKGVREARKQLVLKIGKELELLEQKVSERLTEAASPAVASVPVPEVVVPVEEVQHKQVEDMVMIDNAEPSNAAAAATGGYDVEPLQDTAVTQVKAVEEPIPESTSASQAMEVEPVEVPVPAVAEAVALSPTPAAPKSELVSQEVTDQTAIAAKAARTISLEETSSDEEESEIEDAVHIMIENDEVVAHDEQRGGGSDQEVDYELI